MKGWNEAERPISNKYGIIKGMYTPWIYLKESTCFDEARPDAKLNIKVALERRRGYGERVAAARACKWERDEARTRMATAVLTLGWTRELATQLGKRLS